MSTTFTPLRYPGGKSRLARYLSHLIDYNHLTDCLYAEPFAGGAGAAINLLHLKYVSAIYLNDIDSGIYAFWYSILNHTDKLCQLVENVTLTVEEWQRQRNILQDATECSLLELGFAVLYMNRTNRSGIIRGGVIGGQGQSGQWKIDSRFNRHTLIKKIRRISGYRSRIHLSCLDASEFLSNVIAINREHTLIYLDPPYYKKGQFLYHNHYDHNDHVALAASLNKVENHSWVVTYDNVDEIQEIYGNHRFLTYGINYSASDRYKGKEVMFFGPTVQPLPFGNPLNIPAYA
jgi:DNA adenine methylase